MGEALAVIESDPETLAEAVGTAALDAEEHEPHEEMFVRVDSTGVSTPASAVDASQSSFCTFHPTLFDELQIFEPIAALFPVETVLDWLSYFEGSDRLTVTLIGEPGAEHATQLRLEGPDREVRIDCVDAPGLLSEVELWLPDRFEGTEFLDGSGNPVETTVETTAPELVRIVDAVEQLPAVSAYPLTVDSSGIQFEVSGEGVAATGTISGTVDGPGFEAQFGPGFARILRTVDGRVTLQTGPGEPLAIVSREPGVTYRYVLDSTE